MRAEEKRREGNSLSSINIISMGAQNGLCQQNTGSLSGEEHENEREETAGLIYMEQPIYHRIQETESKYVNVTETKSKSLKT